jgi:hypothetical protein
MKYFACLAVAICLMPMISQADSYSLEEILKSNSGLHAGKYVNQNEADCSLQIYRPGEYVKTDKNYWVENDWQVAVEFASYPDATASGGFVWELNSEQHFARFFPDASKRTYRDFTFDPNSLKFISFTAFTGGAQGNTCRLK